MGRIKDTVAKDLIFWFAWLLLPLFMRARDEWQSRYDLDVDILIAAGIMEWLAIGVLVAAILI